LQASDEVGPFESVAPKRRRCGKLGEPSQDFVRNGTGERGQAEDVAGDLGERREEVQSRRQHSSPLCRVCRVFWFVRYARVRAYADNRETRHIRHKAV
jgi:hypothetical protein